MSASYSKPFIRNEVTNDSNILKFKGDSFVLYSTQKNVTSMKIELIPTVSVFKVLMLVVHHVLFIERLTDLVLTIISSFALSITVTSAVSHILLIE